MDKHQPSLNDKSKLKCEVGSMSTKPLLQRSSGSLARCTANWANKLMVATVMDV